jgi:hypothetical protein
MLFGIAFLVMAGVDNPPLGGIAAYAAGGGLQFASQAWLLARRRRQVTRAT